MTAYEKVKTALLCLLAGVLVMGAVKTFALLDAWAVVPSKLTATLDSLNQVGPQATSTLRTLQATTDAVGKQATASLKVSDKAGKVLDGAAIMLDAVNRPCGARERVAPAFEGFGVPPVPALYDQVFLPCGTLADVNRTLSTARGAIGQVEAAARHEDRNLGDYDAQERQLYADVHAATVNLNALIASPDIARFLKSSADTSAQVAAIAADVHKETDALVKPQPWWKKAYTYGNTGVNVACLVTHSCPF